MTRRLATFVLFLTGAWGCAFAQGVRDPTVPPDGAGQEPLGMPAARAAGIEGGAFTIIVRNGVPSLVVGTRLYSRGQKLGNASIERITETEVWLREGRVLRKVSQFRGIERRTESSASPKISPSRCGQAATSNVSCANNKP